MTDKTESVSEIKTINTQSKNYEVFDSAEEFSELLKRDFHRYDYLSEE